MITDTGNKILEYIHTHKQARAHDLVKAFGISQVAIHRQLKKLLNKDEVSKVGIPPLVFYIPKEKKETMLDNVSDHVKKIIDKNYLYISPIGELLYGLEGFATWAKGINEEKRLQKLANEYVNTLDNAKKHFKANKWIDATKKLKNTFKETYVDKLLYADFYSLPQFGKTKLGQLVLYSKQSQNRELINQISTLVKPLIEKVIKELSIDAVAFVPPTVPRNLQFMNELETILNLKLPSIELSKVTTGEVVVAQKTLSRLEERIINARNTIFTKNNKGIYHNVLLIDDAAGSGSTFNETAKKLKSITGGKNKIVAFAIVGSFKGFDVIREV